MFFSKVLLTSLSFFHIFFPFVPDGSAPEECNSSFLLSRPLTEKEREIEREIVCVCVSIYVCVGERDRDGGEKETERK